MKKGESPLQYCAELTAHVRAACPATNAFEFAAQVVDGLECDKELRATMQEWLKREQPLVHTYNKSLEGRAPLPAPVQVLHGDDQQRATTERQHAELFGGVVKVAMTERQATYVMLARLVLTEGATSAHGHWEALQNKRASSQPEERAAAKESTKKAAELELGELHKEALIVVPIPNKEASTTSQLFLLHVLSQYGACAEVVTDNGSEFKAEFDQLLERALIDHRWTSRGHPQADGLAERAVQTVKAALRRCLEKEQKSEWDEIVPWITMGYNASPQASTKLTPYEVLLGREPVVPPAVVQRMSEMDLQREADKLHEVLLQRALLMREHCIVAGGNLRMCNPCFATYNHKI